MAKRFEMHEISKLLDQVESGEVDVQQLSGAELRALIGTNLACSSETKQSTWVELETRQDKSNDRRYV